MFTRVHYGERSLKTCKYSGRNDVCRTYFDDEVTCQSCLEGLREPPPAPRVKDDSMPAHYWLAK